MSEPFLRKPSTIQAIEQLARAQRLVLYCGAGVTRDQTGLGWEAMVQAVFDAAKRGRVAERQRDTIVTHMIASPMLAPQQKASLVVQLLKPDRLTEPQFLDRYLRRILYKERGWSHGLLLRNIATLADFYAKSRREVTIVTTNYDDYLVRRLDRLIRETADDADSEDVSGRPGLKVTLLGSSSPLIELPAEGKAYTIEIVYVHGFVASDELIRDYPQAEGQTGDLVFSEKSYVETELRTSEYLTDLLGKGTSLVTIGASLSDPPLIRALVDNIAKKPAVFALADLPFGISPDPLDEQTSAESHEILAARTKQIGVKYALLPSSYSQVAQLIEEVRVCAAIDQLSSSDLGDHYSTSGNYASRLGSWWQQWSESSESKEHEDHYLALWVALDEINIQLNAWGCSPVEGEVLRLELWLRVDPSVSRDRRVLTLFANSSGPIYSSSGRREEPIVRQSTIASVRAFTAGKPALTTLDDLGHSNNSSRWRTFLSVPIFHEVGVPILEDGLEDELVIQGSVPVAVVTLSSTAGGRNSPDSACFVDKRLGNDEYNKILDLMISAGREVATTT